MNDYIDDIICAALVMLLCFAGAYMYETLASNPEVSGIERECQQEEIPNER